MPGVNLLDTSAVRSSIVFREDLAIVVLSTSRQTGLHEMGSLRPRICCHWAVNL